MSPEGRDDHLDGEGGATLRQPAYIEIEVVDVQGRGIPDAVVKGVLPQWVFRASREGVVLIAEEAVGMGELLVTAIGYELKVLEEAEDGAVVSLESGTWVTVCLPEDVDIPAPPEYLAIEISLPLTEGGWRGLRVAGVDSRGFVAADICLEFDDSKCVKVGVPMSVQGLHISMALTSRSEGGGRKSFRYLGLMQELALDANPILIEHRPEMIRARIDDIHEVGGDD